MLPGQSAPEGQSAPAWSQAPPIPILREEWSLTTSKWLARNMAVQHPQVVVVGSCNIDLIR